MRIVIDTTANTIANADEPEIYKYHAASPIGYAVRVVEKLLKVHIKAQRQESYITSRTR